MEKFIPHRCPKCKRHWTHEGCLLTEWWVEVTAQPTTCWGCDNVTAHKKWWYVDVESADHTTSTVDGAWT
jgi:hypothetical protein